jgi:hypothetical protein
MRILALAILAVVTVCTTEPAAAQAYDRGYPVCLQVYGIANYTECNYTSLAQCAGSASGRPAQCVVNPFFANAQVPAGPGYGRRSGGY